MQTSIDIYKDRLQSNIDTSCNEQLLIAQFFSQKLIEVVHGHLERGWHSGAQLDQWLSSLSTFPADMS